jgi:hypothetical protein
MLKLNVLRPIMYYANNAGMGRSLNIPHSIIIKFDENGFYEAEIKNAYNINKHYFQFKIINVKNFEKIIKGQLVEISLEDSDGNWYIDENAKGVIEINLENNLVTMEIIIGIYHEEHQYKLIWEN